MTNEEIFDEVVAIARRTFEEPDMLFTPLIGFKDVKNWDSISNLLFIDELEKKFEMTFSLDNILDAENLGDFCKTISQGLAKK